MGRIPVRDAGRIPAVVANISDIVKGPRHKTVGKTGTFNENGITRGVPTSGYDMDNDGANVGGGGWGTDGCGY